MEMPMPPHCCKIRAMGRLAIVLLAAIIVTGCNGISYSGISGEFDSLGVALDISVSGDYAYIADVENGLVILDISYPSNPYLATAEPTHGSARSVLATGNYVFAGTDAGIDIYDVRDPYHPYFMTLYTSEGVVNAIEVYDNMAIVSTSTGIEVLDLQDYQSIHTIARFTIASRHTHTVNDTIYIANDDIRRIDITTIDSPVFLDRIYTDGYAMDVIVSGNYIYVADGYRGIKIYDKSNPDSLVLLSRLDTPGEARDIKLVSTVERRFLVVADLDGGLRVIDVTDPASPLEVEQVDIPGNAYSVDYSDGYAYVCAGTEGLKIIRLNLE